MPPFLTYLQVSGPDLPPGTEIHWGQSLPPLMVLYPQGLADSCRRWFLTFPRSLDFTCMSFSMDQCIFLRKEVILLRMDDLSGCFFCVCVCVLFMAVPVAYGRSHVRGQIRVVAASLYRSHSNAGPELCLQPTPGLAANAGSLTY